MQIILKTYSVSDTKNNLALYLHTASTNPPDEPFLFPSSLNSIIPLRVAASAAAVSQNNLARPHPSCRFT